MGVHEARDDAAAVGVDDCRALGQADPARPAARRAHPDDLAVAGGDGGLLEEAERAFALDGLAGDQLADAVDDQVGLNHLRRVGK